MKILAAALTATFLLVTIFFAFALDDWLGILAYKYGYIGFALLIAVTVAAVWRVVSKRISGAAGLAAFALLMTPFLIKTPSSRILREVMINVNPGTAGSKIEERVQQAYLSSGYEMPLITKSGTRIDVSLVTQREGDCTAALFHLENGIVVGSTFSAD